MSDVRAYVPTTKNISVHGVPYRICPLAGLASDNLPYSIRILLENLLRAEDGVRITRSQIEATLDWGSAASFASAIDLSPSRVFLHDTNGIPALVV